MFFHSSKKSRQLYILAIFLLLQSGFAASQVSTEISRNSLVRPEFRGKCKKPEFPSSSLSTVEDGALQIAVRVGIDGKATTMITQFSSGFSKLDDAAKYSLRKCHFTPGTVNGRPVPMFTTVFYLWVDTGEGLSGPHWQKIIASGRSGNLDAMYIIAQLQINRSETTTTGIELLKIAANQGFSLAQFDLAERYEYGDGLKKDLELAEQWYSKATEHGNIVALERAKLMSGSTGSVIDSSAQE